MQLVARLAILLFAFGLVLQPVVTGAPVIPGECCCTMGLADDGCCAAESTLQEPDEAACPLCELACPDEPEKQPEDKPDGPCDRDGCDCPMSCCSGIVKVDMGVVYRGVVGPSAAPGFLSGIEPGAVRGDAHTKRLKRPPKVFSRA